MRALPRRGHGHITLDMHTGNALAARRGGTRLLVVGESNLLKPMGKVLFLQCGNMYFPADRVKALGGHQKELHFKFMLFDFRSQIQRYSWERIPGNTFAGKPENRKKCYHEWQTHIFIFSGKSLGALRGCFWRCLGLFFSGHALEGTV